MKVFEVRSNQQGFTLAEMALVLVIIGVLTGMVLKAKGIANYARGEKMSKQITELYAVSTLYYNSNNRYPGGNATYVNGTRDDFFEDLADADLVVSAAVAMTSPFEGNINATHEVVTGLFDDVDINYLEFKNIPGNIGCASDKKLDDGNGTGGLMQFTNSTGGAENVCIENDASKSYTLYYNINI